VAAIAAGVLINTAGFLQSQSEQTGEQSSAQVSDRLQVVNVVGQVDSSGDSISQINLTVSKAPGANDVSLGNTTIQYVDDDQIVQLVHADRSQGAGADDVFYTNATVDSDNSITNSLVVNNQDDRAIITISTTGFSTQPAAGQTADITLTTQAGGETTVTITVPDSLSQKSSVAL
ncbi:MAG: flagellin, partial [Haloarculaceae archaeon]